MVDVSKWISCVSVSWIFTTGAVWYISPPVLKMAGLRRPAIFSTGGEMYHTAPVVKIHETETQEIHFETSTTHYYIKPRPFVLAVLNPRRQTLAACA